MFPTTPYLMLLHYLGKCKCLNYTIFRIKVLTKTYSVIDQAIGEWRKRLYACIRAKGGHFEHII